MGEFEHEVNQHPDQGNEGHAPSELKFLWDYLEPARNNVSVLRRFEKKLERDGLLSQLEASGILPLAQNPNPFNPQLEPKKYGFWWWDEEGRIEEFRRNVWRRLNALSKLFTGAVIGYFYSQQPEDDISKRVEVLLIGEEDAERQVARQYVEAYFRRTDRRKNKQLYQMLREISRLDTLHPELVSEVYWQEKQGKVNSEEFSDFPDDQVQL
jgi:hypothetical protein